MINSLQKTPVDENADIVIHGLCDKIMQKVMEILKIPVPEFTLKRQVKLIFSFENQNILIEGLDCCGQKMSIFTKIVAKFNKTTKILKKEPYIIKIPDIGKMKKLQIYAEFYGNHNEPKLNLDIEEIPKKNEEITYEIEFNFKNPDWIIKKLI